jgi:hypothetical protein
MGPADLLLLFLGSLFLRHSVVTSFLPERRSARFHLPGVTPVSLDVRPYYLFPFFFAFFFMVGITSLRR